MLSTLITAGIGVGVLKVVKDTTQSVNPKRKPHGKYCRCYICMKKRGRRFI